MKSCFVALISKSSFILRSNFFHGGSYPQAGISSGTSGDLIVESKQTLLVYDCSFVVFVSEYSGWFMGSDRIFRYLSQVCFSRSNSVGSTASSFSMAEMGVVLGQLRQIPKDTDCINWNLFM